MQFAMIPVGFVHGGRTTPDDDDWGGSRAVIELDGARFEADALAGLDAFSHLEVVYVFDRVDEARIVTGARHPRGNPDWPKVGVFAQRAKARPNRIGIGVCRILKIDGLRVEVEGLDAIDGTPVLDLKPVMSGFAPRGEVREPEWAKTLMAGYW
ncbi:MAG: SAM-dependent methyltransferase [Caulobacteraceae bacterium]